MNGHDPTFNPLCVKVNKLNSKTKVLYVQKPHTKAALCKFILTIYLCLLTDLKLQKSAYNLPN